MQVSSPQPDHEIVSNMGGVLIYQNQKMPYITRYYEYMGHVNPKIEVEREGALSLGTGVNTGF